MTQKKKIGDMLIEKGVIDKYQLKAALNRQERWGKKLGETLVEMGFITEEVLVKTLSMIFNIPSIRPEKFEISKAVLSLVPREVCTRLSLIPLAIKTVNNKKRLIVAMSDPTNYSAVDELRFLTNLPVLPMVTSIGSIDASLRKYYGIGMVKDNDSEVSMISRSASSEEFMEIIRQGREDKVNVSEKPQKENVFERAEVDEKKAMEAESSEFSKALDDRLKNFEIEPAEAMPEPFEDYEYEESTGVFKDENILNKLLKVLKNKSLLSDDELKTLLGVSIKDAGKLKGSGAFKALLELLHRKKIISDKEKKLIEGN